MNHGIEGQRRFIIQFVYWLLLGLCGFCLLKYLLPLIWPFLAGLGLAALLNPAAAGLGKRFPKGRKWCSIAVLLVFYLVAGLAVGVFGAKLFSSIESMAAGLPQLFKERIQPFLAELPQRIAGYFPDWVGGVSVLSSSLDRFLSALSAATASRAALLASQLPSILVQGAFALLASFFFMVDYPTITRKLLEYCPKSIGEGLVRFKREGLNTLGRFCRAYALLLSITFAELSLGFWFLKFPHPFTLAFLIALVDILPVLGTGTVLVPWAVLELMERDFTTGIWLLVIYGVVTVVRNVLEPKIVGKEIGLHPILMLLSLYLGGRLFGVVGIFILPMLLAVAVRQLTAAEKSPKTPSPRPLD